LIFSFCYLFLLHQGKRKSKKQAKEKAKAVEKTKK